MAGEARVLRWGVGRGGKIGPTRWASPIRPELGPAGPLNYWPEKNQAKFGLVQYGPARYGLAQPGMAQPGPVR